MAVGGMSKQEVADFINANIGILRYLIGTFSNAYRAEYEASQIGGLYKFGNGLDGVIFKAIENFFTLNGINPKKQREEIFENYKMNRNRILDLDKKFNTLLNYLDLEIENVEQKIKKENPTGYVISKKKVKK